MTDFSRVKQNLEARGFRVSVFATAAEAADYLDSAIDNTSVGFGGSVTLEQMGLYERLERHDRVNWHWRPTVDGADARQAAMTAEHYITSVNGLAETGELINIDGTGNRVAAMVFGPKSVVVIAGINKVVKSYEDAVARARNLAAPVNVQRFANFNPPCKNNGHCFNCTAPDSICNFILTTRKGSTMNALAPRIKVILVGESLGY